MKLEKKDRERLYKAKGKPVKIEWPLEYAPRRGQRHAVHGDSGERVFSVRVEGVIWRDGCALVKIDNDPIRIMPGLTHEPERVHADYEALLVNENAYKSRLIRAEHRQRQKSTEAMANASKGKLANEFAVRQQKRLREVA